MTTPVLSALELYHVKLIEQVGNMMETLMIAKGLYDRWHKAQLSPHYTDDNPPVDEDKDTTSLAGLLGSNNSSSIRSGGTGAREDEKDSWNMLLGHPLRDRVETLKRDILPLETSDDIGSPVDVSTGPLKATASLQQTTITS